VIRRTLIVAAFFALTACMDKPVNPGGGNNPPPSGGPNTPDPIATTGTISGSVSTAGSGIGLNGARVLLDTTASATTDTSGHYRFTDVAAGTHTVTFVPPQFLALAPGEISSKPTTVTAGQTSVVNWTVVPGPLPPVTWVVFLDPSAFRPRDVTIARGDTVLWSNAQPIFHTISPDDRNQPGAWRTENMPAHTGASFSHVFNTEGVFTYSCTVHAGMTGVVRVR
jgi:plastocyanin